MERAYELRDQRERIRQQAVKEALDRQWREACDDARTLDSEALLSQCDKERKAQMQEKLQRKQNLKNSENDFNEAWLEHVTQMENAEKEKDARRHRLEKENKAMLKDQVISSIKSNILF